MFRLGDMAPRGQFAGAFWGNGGALFAAESDPGRTDSAGLLARASDRAEQSVLFVGALLTTLGVVFNRMNVVLFAMTLTGSMPQISPETYMPTVVEWGISVGLIAATIFLFGLAARLMPVLPKAEPAVAQKSFV